MHEVGVVAALRLEVRDSVRRWRTGIFRHGDRTFQTFHSRGAVLLFAGMGVEPARQAAEALVWKYGPKTLVSLGFAGAASPELREGELFLAARVHSEKGEVFLTNAERARGTLVTTSHVAGREEKRRLRERLSADAVDMEAAAVARVALEHGLKFLAVKAISDAHDLPLPPFERFVRPEGGFDIGAFVLYAAMRPHRWPTLARLARNAAVASAALGQWLGQYNEESPVGGKEIARTR